MFARNPGKYQGISRLHRKYRGFLGRSKHRWIGCLGNNFVGHQHEPNSIEHVYFYNDYISFDGPSGSGDLPDTPEHCC